MLKPTSEVSALVRMGFDSSAALYAFQKATRGLDDGLPDDEPPVPPPPAAPPPAAPSPPKPPPPPAPPPAPPLPPKFFSNRRGPQFRPLPRIAMVTVDVRAVRLQALACWTKRGRASGVKDEGAKQVLIVAILRKRSVNVYVYMDSVLR